MDRVSLASVEASWPPVLTTATWSPFLSGRITLKDAVPPQPQLPPARPVTGLAELCSLCTLRLDTDSTASTRSPCFAVSTPEIRYRPSSGTVKIPEGEDRNDSVWVQSIMLLISTLLVSKSLPYSWTCNELILMSFGSVAKAWIIQFLCVTGLHCYPIKN